MDIDEFKLTRLSNYSQEMIIEEIIRVDNIVRKEILTKKEFLKHSRVGDNTILRKFGSWKNALEMSGIGEKYSGTSTISNHKNQYSKKFTDDEILNTLKNISKNIGNNCITVNDFRKSKTPFGYETILKRFGSFRKAVELAELETSNHGKRYTDDECFENLLNVWTFYKRQPEYREMGKYPSVVGGKAYVGRWGSWIKSLEAFIKKLQNNDTIIPINNEKNIINYEITVHKKSNEDKRDIPIGLRFNVLKRDNYKCKICGGSPAIDNNIQLQVDHIYPFSKGGKTMLENLQTLCKDCNLGKSNKKL